MPDKPRPEAVSILKAAALMDVHPETIRRLIKAGKLPAIRLGGQWRIKLSVLIKGSTPASHGATSR